MKKTDNKILNYVICGLILIIGYKIADNYEKVWGFVKNIADVFFPVVVGIIIAFFTSRPAQRLEDKFKSCKNKFLSAHAAGLGILSVYLVFFAIVAFAIMFISPKIYKNAVELVSHVPEYYEDLREFLSENDFVASYVSFDAIKSYLSGFVNLENVNKWFGVISSVASSFLMVFLTVIISIYINIEKRDIFSFMRTVKGKLFNTKGVNVLIFYIKRTIDVFYSYISGMALDAVIVGTISAIALSIFKVPYAVLLGVLVAVGNMIPFFGGIISAVIITAITLFSLGPFKALWVLVFQLVLGQIDGNLIQPRILSSSTGISPLLVLVSVLVFGNLFGIPGMILGVPICAAIKMLVLDYLDNGELDGSYTGKKENNEGEK